MQSSILDALEATREGKKTQVLRKVQKRQLQQKNVKLETWEEFVQRKYNCKCYACPGIYANAIMDFVGFRGSKDKDNVCTLNIKGKEHEGEAWPPPIVPVTNINRDNLIRLTGKSKKQLGSRFFLGILDYEVEIMVLLYTLSNAGYENLALLMSRGQGKTYIFAWDEQIHLKHFKYNYMMLSETNARRKVGNWIYVWALRNNLLKEPEKYARKSTYQHFELINGNRMDIYKYSEEDLVGEHDYIIKMDDVVKRKWRERPTENQKMIDHYQSNINYIIRAGLHLTGTCKFEGDPLSHIIKNTEDMVIIIYTPFIKCPHNNVVYNQTFEVETYDICDICKDKALLAPQIHSYNELNGKMHEDWEAWYAEAMQDPKPMKGGMVDDTDLEWVNRPFFTEVQLICIAVDSTESDLDSVDMCGIVSCAMLKPKTPEDNPEFVFLDADVRKMPFRTLIDDDGKEHRGIMETIGFLNKMYEIHYPGVTVIIAIERQGGGLFVIKEARANPKDHPWVNKLIGERKLEKKPMEVGLNELGIKHTKAKVPRVYSELRFPIKNKQVMFANNLFGSEFITQVCTFPKGKYDDGADAGGMAKDECLKRWSPKGKIRKTREMKQAEKKEAKAAEAHKLAGQPWLKDKRKGKQRRMVMPR